MTIRLALVLIAGLNTIIMTPALGVEPDQQVSPTLTSDVASGPNSVTTSVAAASLDLSQAEDAETANREWNVSFTPYLWAAGVNGDLRIPRAGSKVEIDRSFSDILGNLKFAFMGALDVEYHRFVGIADVMYLNIGAKAENIENPLITEGKVDAKTLVASGAIGYRVVDKGPMFFDVVAGARLVSLDVDVELTSPLGIFGAGASPSNVSPMVGGRVRVPLGARWGAALYGDVGINSDLKWQLIGSVQYDLARHWRAAIGYRHMAIHHDRERGDIDLALSGPIFGISYRF